MPRAYISLLVLLLAALLLCGCAAPAAEPESTAIPISTAEPTPTPEPTPEPTPPPEPEPLCTAPYKIKVNLECNTVTVYGTGEDGEEVPYKAMVCSTGSATPKSGVYDIRWQGAWDWLGLFGDVYGQYATQITGNILFHSVPYLVKFDKSSLEYWQFDQLGTACSMGCVRLMVADAKWIFDNKPDITTVEFYSDADPGPLGKPVPPTIGNDVDRRGWDPTDPDPENPWNE